MLSTSLLSFRNMMIIWYLYKYYDYADKIYTGYYYSKKILNYSKKSISYIMNYRNDNTNKIDNSGVQIHLITKDDWVIIERQ